MRLSVLIPVYQQDVRVLVMELYRQLKATSLSFEISCIDDCSSDEYRIKNRNLLNPEYPEIRYEELKNNLGRSAIRNRLAMTSSGEFLWFLDCDSMVAGNEKLTNCFIEKMKRGVLLSGGRIYQADPPENMAKYLHWLWGSRRELLEPERRMKDSVNHFLSNNFVIHRDDFNQVKFNTALSGYGYEDTFFAYELKVKGIETIHILNPVLHDGLEDSTIFLSKIEESLHNLLRLESMCREQAIGFPLKSKLVQAYQTLCRPLFKPFALGFTLFLPALRRKLLSPKPALWALDLYRLFYLLKIS